MRLATLLALVLALVWTAGCTRREETDPRTSGPGSGPYVDPDEADPFHLGIASKDIRAMCDKLVRSMARTPVLVNRDVAARVVLDSRGFKNDGVTPVDMNLITDRLAAMLQKAAGGKLVFLSDEDASLIRHHRDRKREGLEDEGTTGMTPAVAGVDFRLTGRIADQAIVNPKTGYRSRYHQFYFKMVDMETGQIVWSGMYDFKKAGVESLLYD
jgi:PBP1b-binding outer membrane lipoprotein LpoB